MQNAYIQFITNFPWNYKCLTKKPIFFRLSKVHICSENLQTVLINIL